MRITGHQGTQMQKAAAKSAERFGEHSREKMRARGVDFIQVTAKDAAHYEALRGALGLKWPNFVQQAITYVLAEAGVSIKEEVTPNRTSLPYRFKKADGRIADMVVEPTEVRHIRFDTEDIPSEQLARVRELPTESGHPLYAALEAFTRATIEAPEWATRPDVSNEGHSLIRNCGVVAVLSEVERAA